MTNKKLLHERLREASSDFLDDGIARTLADEIERDYIPRPRFEDGEPVSKGCEVEGGIVDGWHVWDDGAFTLNDEEGNILQEAEPGEFVKRPTPKVYDADGVEIKVGDIVYNSFRSHYVESIEDKCGTTIICYAGGEYDFPCDIYHEPIILDSDNKRINVGDTVWHVGDANKGVVVNFRFADQVKVAWNTGDEGFYKGNALTHRKPDSLKRVRDYARKIADDGAYNEDELNEIADRLTALIERGA